MEYEQGVIEQRDNKMFCCDTEMEHIPDGCMGMLQMNITECEMWLCKKCGNYIKHETGQLDPEEIECYE